MRWWNVALMCPTFNATRVFSCFDTSLLNFVHSKLSSGVREREDIFSQVFTMIHIKSFVQNIQTKTEMEPHDQFWPSSCDTLILLDQFLLSWHSFLSCSISYVVSREGKCHLQPKIVHIIFKKARKRIQFSFVVRIGANEVRQTDKMGKAQKIQLYCFM